MRAVTLENAQKLCKNREGYCRKLKNNITRFRNWKVRAVYRNLCLCRWGLKLNMVPTSMYTQRDDTHKFTFNEIIVIVMRQSAWRWAGRGMWIWRSFSRFASVKRAASESVHCCSEVFDAYIHYLALLFENGSDFDCRFNVTKRDVFAERRDLNSVHRSQ